MSDGSTGQVYVTVSRRAARRRAWAAVILAPMALIGLGMIGYAFAAAPTPPPSPHARHLAGDGNPKVPAMPASAPVRLDITAIDVHAPVATAGLAADGSIAVPPLAQPYLTNWYDRSVAPGVAGSSVIVGHVDTDRVGPAVFYRLGSLKAGDALSVTRQDHTVAVFRVTAVAIVAKAAFPSAQVYGPVTYPALRLITCGGSFNRRTHNYDSNTIVSAVLESWHKVGKADTATPLRTYIPDKPKPVKPTVTKPRVTKPKVTHPAARPTKPAKPKPTRRSR